MTTPATDPSLRLLALTLTALYRRGLQHVAEARREEGRVVIVLWGVNAKLRRQVALLLDQTTKALGQLGLTLSAIPFRTTAFEVAPATPETLATAPSVEAMAMLLGARLRKRLEFEGLSGGPRMSVMGVSTGVGSGMLYVTGGSEEPEGGTNARAVAWCRAWLARHFPELVVEDAPHPVSRLSVWHVNGGEVRRALRVSAAAPVTKAA